MRGHGRELLALFAVALLVRVAAMLLHGCPAHADGKDAWSWGYESACIGSSVAEGRGFAGQWARDETPWNEAAPVTGWLTPAYPSFVALAMQVGGGVTRTTAAIVLVAQCVLSALTCLFAWGIGAAMGELRWARFAGWVLAFLPYSIWSAAHTVWDTTAVACALTLFVELVLRFGSPGRGAGVARASMLGLAFGALLLVNPAPGSVLPAALWLVARSAPSFGARLARVAAFGLAAFVVCLPWCLRNERAVGSFALRTNLGVEMMVGNNDRANGYFQTSLHPSYSSSEFRRYVELGEVRYAAECMQRAKTWMLDDPVRWARLTLRRAAIYWLGDFPLTDPRTEGARRAATDPASWLKWTMHASLGLLALAGCVVLLRRPGEGRALAAMVLLFPLPYYATHVLERYRFPVEPLLVVAAAPVVLAIADRVRASSRGAR